MLLDFSNLNEEPLKNQIKAEFFKDKKFLYSGDKIDFMLSYKHSNATLPILWGEAKRGDFDDLDKAFTQLLLTIGKHRLYTHHTPPYLCAFNAFKMEFIAFDDTITSFFYKSDIDFSITPSNHNTEGFKHALDAFKAMSKSHKFVFDFKTQSQECKEFIKNRLNSSHLLSKIQIDKNNFFTIYQKWLEIVKPTIDINWEVAKTKDILDADYYLADLLSDGDKTIIEKLHTILRSSHYKLNRGVNELGKMDFMEVGFTDSQQAHQEFWSVYERPPKREFQASILERRDLLVPSDVRERKGAFFTPKIWVEKSQEYLAKALGQDYQEDCIIWDCAGGTGNLLRGLLNKANLYLSTLDHNDVAIVKDLAAKNHLKLLENHVFQFDFLNDDFFSDKTPKSLQEILKDKEKRKKLIIYINPPYAEAGNKSKMSGTGEHKAKVARDNLICEKYKNELGKANNEVFAQFFMRIYKELNGVILASFSTLKNLQGSNFKKFREIFKAKFLEGFMVPADTFDNVRGQFPIGFLVWDTSSILPKENPLNLGGNSKEEKQNSNLILDQDNLKDNPLKERFCLLDINAPNRKMCSQSRTRTKGTQKHSTAAPFETPLHTVSLEIFDSFGGFLGSKKIYTHTIDKMLTLADYLQKFQPTKRDTIFGYLDPGRNSFQHQNLIHISIIDKSKQSHVKYFPIIATTILLVSVFFSIRHCIKATWQNDRDQFYAPYDDAFQDDSEFKNNCLIFMLFHTQNRITTAQGTNHFIPFSETEVNAKERYSSHALLEFLKGEIKELKENDSLFLSAKKENKPLKFSPSASKVFDASREVYRYYHTQDFTNRPYNANASLYDIKEFFQGRNKQGKLNLPAKAKDEYYKQLYANLQDALKDLAKEIQPKVYEYGFLRE
ncbi:hypothetical protein [Helicobacter pylori]|jgi:hypothetical protein|nr:hypothetical protein [Helicobacter pylori]AFV42653.1 hypothetical protein C694_07420 [Helicobacter pylori 26695]AFV44248.1 hypothetical protein C695_07430 [Helicobacter pylori Rif1]AFV45840.1 hypothetical protein C730_07425 [Helicobacter pylori Rif2]AJF09644.1 hypothetical protein SE87_07385 [Helicobacter pylori 26695-1]AJF11184.1 hypothetical protein SE88_07380 [Helicobacter pylori]